MKINKNILICALLVLVMLCAISTVSAEDTDIEENLTISDSDEGAIEQDNSQDVLEVSDNGNKISEGNTLYVGDDQTYTTISSAITAASSGDTIFIKNGHYQEGKFTITDKNLIFEGESKENVVIDYTTSQYFISTSDANQITVKNMQFKGTNSGNNGLFQFTYDTNALTIENCIFDNCGSKTLLNLNKATVSIKDTQFLNCRITSSAGAFIQLAGGSAIIENCLINNTSYTATSGQTNALIYNNGAGTITVSGTTISKNEIYSNSIFRCNSGGTININSNSRIVDNFVMNRTGTIDAVIFYNTKNAINVDHSVIANNTVRNFIYAGSSSTGTKIEYCNIQNNHLSESNFIKESGSTSISKNYWGSNDEPTVSGATPYVIYDSGSYKLSDDSEDNINILPLTEEPAPVTYTIYVDSVNGDDNNDGSSVSSAVKTISGAIAKLSNGKIILLAGTHTIAETITLTQDVDFTGRTGAIISSAAQMFNNPSYELNFNSIKFISTVASGNVIVNNGNLNIEKCIFEAVTSGNTIYAENGATNIADSILLNANGQSIAKSTGAVVTANNNWWGVNATPNAVAENWIVMNAGIDLSKIYEGDEVTITATFTKLNTGDDYTGTLPEFNVTFTADNLNENVAVKNNQASVKYTVNADDEATVTSGSESINIPLKLYEPPEVIYVNATGGLDTNDGDEAHPVQSISKAIELAVKGKIIILEGTYSIDNTLTVNNDLDITGQGTVIIDGNSKRILNNNANLNITNVRFTNGFDSSAVLVNNANLTLTNTLFYSNVNLNGYGASVVRNNKKLTVVDSKFYENKERYGNIYNNEGELLINNTEFYNNDLTTVTTVATGLAIYSEAGNAVIENSKFYNNKGNFSVIYFLSKDSLSSSVVNNLTIDNCTFDNNELVRYGVIYSQKANTTIRDSTFTNNIVKMNNAGIKGDGAAVYVTGQKANVETSVFINNNADGSGNDIYVYAGQLDISDSVLINENGYSIENASSSTVIANNNWWGSNAPNTPIAVDKWIVMTVTSNDTEIETGDTVIITASFNKTNDGADYTGDLPEVINVTFTSTSENLNEVKTINEKKAEVTYTVDAADKKIIVSSNDANETFKVSRILDIIYVSETDGNDENDGDRDAPVKSIAKALEIVQKGQIVILPGTYKTGYLGIIDRDLNITGEGKVIIDADNNNRVLYIYNTSNVVLKNLIFTNGYTTEALDESGAILGSAGDLTIENCTFANSKSEKNGGAIYNAGNLIVIGCTFENNTADECGGAIFTQSAGIGITPTLTVNNSIFRNNTAKGKSNYGGGAIYVQQAADGVSIVSSIFEDNKCIDYGGGAIEIAQTNVASIDNCTFISNSANGEDYKTRSDYGGGAVSFKGFYDSVRETLTITNSLFLDNEANEYGGGAVFAMYSTVNIQSSVLIDNGDDYGIYVYSRDADVAPAKVNANDNWWGSNDNPKQFINRGTISRWAILTVSNASEIRTGENVELTVSINNYTTGSSNGTLTNPIKVERPVTIYTNLGNIEGTLVNGEFTTDYTVPAGLKIISATVDSETQVLLVISTQTTIKADNITGAMGDRVDYTVNLTTEDNSIINTGNVEVYFGDNLVAIIPVLNNQAISTLMISKPTGEYPITVKYIDETREFVASDATASLNVTGINNVVTPETFDKFFDGEGNLLPDIPFEEIIFKGTFDDMGVLTINKAIRITGENALFNDTVFSIDADDVELNNVEILLNKRFADVDGAAIYVGGNNAVISKSNITYNAPDNVESYAIFVDIASGVKIIDNNIRYSARSEGDVKTIPVYVYRGNGLVFENNCLEANLPSGPMDYQTYDFKSKAVNIVYSDGASVKNNTIRINYTSFSGAYDTIYGVHIATSDNVNVSDNEIKLDSHNLGYGLVMDGKNLKITNNTINVASEDYLAHGLDIQLDSTAVVDGNDITATSKQVVYPIDIEDWGTNAGNVVISNNKIKGESNTVYGVYAQLNRTTISNNDIEVNGNYTIGIVSYQTDLIAENNKIISNGSNVGEALSPQSSVPVETTGICAAEGSIQITNNDVKSTGNSTIDAINTTGSIKNNKLTAGNGEGDATILAKGSSLVIDNKDSDKPVTPSAPVIKLSGKNVIMYYADSAKYPVLVTIDGKAAKGVKVSITFNGKTKTVTTNSKGYAVFTIKNNKLVPKKYTIIAKYGGKVAKNKVTVKQILKSSSKKVKKSAKKLVLKATLKKGKKAIKGKKITFKFKGKKYTAKTNKKGVAKVTIKKNVIKKLKKGKKYAFTVTYLKDTIKRYVKVKK